MTCYFFQALLLRAFYGSKVGLLANEEPVSQEVRLNACHTKYIRYIDHSHTIYIAHNHTTHIVHSHTTYITYVVHSHTTYIVNRLFRFQVRTGLSFKFYRKLGPLV